MKRKPDPQLFFEIDLKCFGDTKGLLTAKDINRSMEVAAPPEFGGDGKSWSPEHLLLGAISSCFMTTFIAFAKKCRLNFIKLDCHAIGQVERVDRSYKFTTIHLYPKIIIPGREQEERASQVLEKTSKYCLITHSLNAAVFHHPEITTIEGTTLPVEPHS